MVRLIGTYDIPEWAICYLVNGDSDELSDEEIKAADEFVDNLMAKYNSNRIIFDTEVMDEEKYGNYYRDEINPNPDFGRKFGADTTWSLPVWVDAEDVLLHDYSLVVMGHKFNQKFEVNIFERKPFIDDDDVELWIDTYFKHLYDLDYHYELVEKFTLNIN